MKKNNCHITLDVMGGEPLLDGETNKNIIRSIIIECEKRNLTFRLISNGVNLIKYIDILSSTKALEFIQITIDGIPSVQIARRISHNQNYIPNLIAGIKAALDSGIRITARTNIDCDNIAKLIDLYKWYNDFGWLKNVNFFPYLSPVHDNTCVACGKNFDEFRILSKLLMYENKYPDIIGIFNKSNFLAYQYLKNPLLTNMFTFPRYYRCEANVNQLVFDPTGLLYACIEAAGHEQYAVGDYSTKLILNEVKLNRWRKYRNVTTLDRCLACKICFICGGNCTWLAFYTELGTDTSRCKMLEKSVGFLLRKRGHILVNNSVV
jgi:radical SAM protein with 4Fe4S-binding SPASM domain